MSLLSVEKTNKHKQNKREEKRASFHSLVQLFSNEVTCEGLGRKEGQRRREEGEGMRQNILILPFFLSWFSSPGEWRE